MRTDPIPGVMYTLKNAGFDEEQRLAIYKSTTDFQYPLLEAIEKMDNRLRNLTIAVYGLILPILFIAYQVYRAAPAAS